MTTRKTAVAGAFYPGTIKEIDMFLKTFFHAVKNDTDFQKEKEELVKNIHGFIVPHAGWMYSGPVAIYAYDLLKELNKIKEKENKPKIKKIIMLGPNHTVYINVAAIDTNEYWETPLGKVKVLKTDINHEIVVYNNMPHLQEHDLEVNVPFLQTTPGNNIEILPIIVGDVGDEGAEQPADLFIKEYADKEDTLFIISTDLSHQLPQETANKKDRNTIDIIRNLDFEKTFEMDACGRNPIIVAMYMCKKLNVKPKLLKYATSGDVTGDLDAVVGYASLVF